jgi:hypothetical protein
MRLFSLTASGPSVGATGPFPSLVRVFPTVVADDVLCVAGAHVGKGDGLPTETAEWRPQRRLVRTRLPDTLEEARTDGAVAGVYFANRRIEHLDCGLVLELAATLRTGE